MNALSLSTSLNMCKYTHTSPQPRRSISHACGVVHRRQSPKRATTVSRADSDNAEEGSLIDRRRALISSTLAMLASSVSAPSLASAGSGLEPYVDSIDKYSLSVPADWLSGTGDAAGAVGTRRVVAFYPPGTDGQTNVNVVATNLSADFTKMGSFGTAYDFGFRLVGSLDRSWVGKKPKFLGGNGKGDGMGQVAKLIDTKEKSGMYYTEYTLSQPGQYDRHLLSVVGLHFDGVYNRLYTVTAQAEEADYPELKSTLTSVIDSFKLPK